MKDLAGYRVLVTGAGSGIGAACAKLFAENGCIVTGVSRTIAEEEKVLPGGGKLITKKLDVTDEEKVNGFVRENGPFEIAVLCAGMGVAGPIEELPMEAARAQMEVNYFGTLTVVKALLPRMRERRRGLLILTGSIAGRVSIPMQSHYSSSKYALEALSDAIRLEMKRYGVRACILEPGDTKTGFTAARKSYIGSSSPYRKIFEKSIAKMAHDEQTGKSPETAAMAALAAAKKKNPPARIPVGADYRALMILLRFLPDRLREWIVGLLYL